MSRKRTLVLGDIHGADRALAQVLERSAFDPGRDRLIALGDVCDGWPEVDRCIDRLLAIDDLVLVLGNHDEWAAEWMEEGEALMGWHDEGGRGTVASYARRAGVEPPISPDTVRDVAYSVPEKHLALLRDAVPYLIETGDDGLRRLFTHAGWNPDRPAHGQGWYDLRLGRELWRQARTREAAGHPAPRITSFDEVYLGHTPTEWLEPRPVLEIWNLDQGAGWDGVLTIMDVRTHEYWQSDPVPELYPDDRGRR